MDPDDGSSLQYVPGAASIPEIEKTQESPSEHWNYNESEWARSRWRQTNI